MYVYSVTINIDIDAEKDWLQFMQKKHIRDVLATGYISSCSMRKAIRDEEDETSTYNMEYTTNTEEKYFEYMQHAASRMRADIADRFEGKFRASRIFYKVISTDSL
jgi:hypothetical protein